MPIDTPFARYEGEVLPAWIDSNGHMNLAYYVVLFDYGTDAIFEALGFGHAYRLATNCGSFAVESHNLYDRELLLGERVRISSLVLGADTKRLHLAHEMVRLTDGSRVAMQELMYLHVDLDVRRVAPFPANLRQRLADAAAAHAEVGVPSWVGRRIALP